jgi:hypothetical protein
MIIEKHARRERFRGSPGRLCPKPAPHFVLRTLKKELQYECSGEGHSLWQLLEHDKRNDETAKSTLVADT